MEDNNTMELQVSEENDLNEYARIKVENFLNKLSEKLAQKAEREIIKEFVSEQEENGIYHVTVLCYFTDDIMKIMKQLEDKKKWKVIEKKNYIEAPKKNGYRGYIVKIGIPVENQKNETAVVTMQIHTIGMEYWLEMEKHISEGKVRKKDKLRNYSEHILQIEEELLRMKKK